MLPAAIRAMFTETVQVRLKSSGGGDGGYAAPSLADPITVLARLSYRDAFRATAQGDQVVTSPVLYMDDIDGFGSGAEITLPDGRTLVVDDWRRPSWPDGSRHLEVTL